MSKKTKIIAILMVVAVFMSIAAISCFAYDTGTEITFKETYTEAELQAYLTEYKDVDGVYYSGSEEIADNLPNLLDLHEFYSEIVILYKGANFSMSNGECTWVIVGKKAADGDLYIHIQDESLKNCQATYKASRGTWDNYPGSLISDGTFTLSDEQFKATGLLWSVPGEKSASISEFLSSIGSGLKSFLPNVAEAGVDTVDILFVTPEGGLTTVAVLTIIGVVLSCALGVFAMIKRKIKKI